MGALPLKSWRIFAGCVAMHRIGPSALVYIDSNVFIYFVEGEERLFAKANAFFAYVDLIGARLATSEMTLAECLYKPAQEQNTTLVETYANLIEQNDEILKIELTGHLAKQAGLIGGSIGLKLMDAVHYVSALQSGCDFLVTADTQFRSGPALTVVGLT